MNIDNLVFRSDDTIVGGGNDDIGEYVIDGQFVSSDEFRFEKTYITYKDEAAADRGKKVILFEGKQSSDDGSIRGKWRMKDDLDNSMWGLLGFGKVETGTFEFTCQLPAWKGYFNELDPIPMDMEFRADPNEGIYGTGVDEQGPWCCAGKFQNGIARFEKHYRESHLVEFAGIYEICEDGRAMITGHWNIPGQDEEVCGDFKMVQD